MNIFEMMSAMISTYLFEMAYEGKWEFQNENRSMFEDALVSIPGANGYFVSKRSINTDLVRLIKRLFVKNGVGDLYDKTYEHKTQEAIRLWKNGSTDIISHILLDNNLAIDTNRVYHAVNFISALNAEFNCFSKPGDSIDTHIKNVKDFLNKIASNRARTAPPVIFYSRSICDIAFVYCTYMRQTNLDYVKLAQELSDVLRGAQEQMCTDKSSTKNIYYSTRSVESDVVSTILDGKLKGATPSNINECGKQAIEELKRYIAEHPYYFIDHRYYGTISYILKYHKDAAMLDPNRCEECSSIFERGGALEHIDERYHNLWALFADEDFDVEKLPVRRNSAIPTNISEKRCELKNGYAWNFFNALEQSTFGDYGDIIYVDRNKKVVKFGRERLWGLSSNYDIDDFCANSVILLRYQLIVLVADYYLNQASRRCRPNAASLYDATKVLEMINSIMDELGLMRLNGIKRETNYIDWCLYTYITDAEVRKAANESLREVSNEI